MTRAGSSNSPKFPAGVDVKTVDFASLDALKAAFAGQDAVVSVVGAPGVGGQTVAIDAAVAAGVKRFIPSEFGVNTRKVRGTPMGSVLAGKIAIVDYLQEKVEGNEGFSWTGLSTGLFFDWVCLSAHRVRFRECDVGVANTGQGLETFGLGIVNLKDKTATVVDSGDEKWQASTLAQVGRAVAKILAHPDETANKYLATASFNLSQNELIGIVEALTVGKFPVTTRKNSGDLQQAAEQRLAQGDFSAFGDLLRVHNDTDGIGNVLAEEESANELIGLAYEDPRAAVESWLKKEGAL